VLKYVIRCNAKGSYEQDLEKALAYLRRLGDQAEILRHLRTVKAPAHKIAAGAVSADYDLTASLSYAVHHVCQASLAPYEATARKHVALAAQHIREELGLDLVRPLADEPTANARPAGEAEDSAPRVERDQRVNTIGGKHAAAS
jgi:hypothetical protein